MTAQAATLRPSGAARARRLPQGWRKTALSLHVVTSVGWLGVHGSMLALAVAAAADPGVRTEALGAAGLLSGMLVLPLSLTAAGTGLLLALGTPWGLFRHTWVAAKLVLTLILVAGSNLSIGPMVRELAADPGAAGGAGTTQAIGALSVSFTVLLATVLLSTVKPFGRLRVPGRGRAVPRAGHG
ncbi:hypothetical protein O4J56_14640 [Nocardiopsis sp. RSe5-2]|uniref:DUF2269 domain-containing protein n=1 Tax=Nocardiopsis endophytica TaxID=3018445 RepID=A0ABT4U4J6_9ACTN|nr:hypothetical protein [Nocardiopsis endophytica]MDA2811878.1 hypothetical protein [Nocardiopsis endophytica]